MTTNEIVDSIYKAYGTDSGILFGIKERDITKAIVEFTINRISDERKALLDSHRELSEVLETVYNTLNNWNTARNDGRYNNLLEYIKPKLNNAKNIQ